VWTSHWRILVDIRVLLKIYQECRANVWFTFDFNFSAEGKNLCFYQIQANAFSFNVVVEPFVQFEKFIAMYFQVNAKAIVAHS